MHTVAGENNFVQFVLYAYANTQGKGNEVNLIFESLWSVLASFRFLFGLTKYNFPVPPLWLYVLSAVV